VFDSAQRRKTEDLESEKMGMANYITKMRAIKKKAVDTK
jgi:hypothetical protein